MVHQQFSPACKSCLTIIDVSCWAVRQIVEHWNSHRHWGLQVLQTPRYSSQSGSRDCSITSLECCPRIWNPRMFCMPAWGWNILQSTTACTQSDLTFFAASTAKSTSLEEPPATAVRIFPVAVAPFTIRTIEIPEAYAPGLTTLGYPLLIQERRCKTRTHSMVPLSTGSTHVPFINKLANLLVSLVESVAQALPSVDGWCPLVRRSVENVSVCARHLDSWDLEMCRDKRTTDGRPFNQVYDVYPECWLDFLVRMTTSRCFSMT